APYPGGLRDGIDRSALRRAQALREGLDLVADAVRDRTELLRHQSHGGDAGASVFGGVADAADFFGGLMRALGGNVNTARDLLRRRTLFRHRRRDRAADRADVADGAFNRLDRLDRTAGRVLHAGD